MEIQKISKLTKQDLFQALDILIDGIKPFLDIPTLKHSKLKSLKSLKNNFIVIKRESKLAGFLMYRIERHTVYLYEIHVCRECQHQGIGSTLIKNLFDTVKEKKIILYVHKKNTSALSFYLKNGFKVDKDYDSINYFEMFIQN